MECLFGVCMLTVSNALLMSSDTGIVRSGGLFWLKGVAMVLFVLRNAVPPVCGDVVCDVWE